MLDYTPSIASIIPDDADDAMLAGDAKQGAEGEIQGNRSPATGRDRAAGQSPLGLTFRYKAARPMPPTMRRTCTYVFGWAFLMRGEGFADWFRRFL